MPPILIDLKRKFTRFRYRHPRLSFGLVLAAGAGTLTLILLVAFVLAVSWGAFGDLPDREALTRIRSPRASEIYAADGTLLGRYFREDRTYCPLDSMPRHLIDALVATEDSRFHDHAGIDYRAWGRVAFKTILQGQEDQGGGSTLSQQLVKNVMPRQRHGWGERGDLVVNKLKEALIARRLEKVYGKEEILELYLNTVAFSDNTYGVAAAARRYWQKKPAELSLEECASLVAMLKATTHYCPLRAPEANRDRRQLVLRLMREQGYLPAAETELPEFQLAYYRPDGYAGPAPHFRESARQRLNEILAELPHPDGRSYDLEADGLRIHTTLDPRLQGHAEAAVRTQLTRQQARFDRHLRKGETPWTQDQVLTDALRRVPQFRRGLAAGKDTAGVLESLATERDLELPTLYGDNLRMRGNTFDSLRHALGTLRAGFLVTDHSQGTVLAWVGGGNPYFSAYDNVSGRHQTGSAFKPLLYAAGLAAGVDPCRRFDNELVTYARYEGWTPQNSNHHYGGTYSLHGGLRHSVNTVAVQLIMDIGADRVVELAQKVGLRDVPAVPSIALGTVEASLAELVAAYTPFVNNGYYQPPRFIDRIENAAGQVIYRARPEREPVLSMEAALTTLDMLRGVVDGGTGWRLRSQHGLRGPLAGKTGTTQDAGDGWFIGLTPQLLGGAWVGGVSPAVRFRRGKYGNGSRSALPIWGDFLERISADPAVAHLTEGTFPTVYKRGFPCSTYLEEAPELFSEETEPEPDIAPLAVPVSAGF